MNIFVIGVSIIAFITLSAFLWNKINHYLMEKEIEKIKIPDDGSDKKK